jgi:two-component system sensor histidine kinase BaeS
VSDLAGQGMDATTRSTVDPLGEAAAPNIPAPAGAEAPSVDPAPTAAAPPKRLGSRRSLAWRLGLLLGIAVLAVLLLAGIIVNRIVSNSYATVLTAQQLQRVDDAAEALGDRLDRPARVRATVRRLANRLGGEVRVLALDGTVLAAFGRPPSGERASYAAPVQVDGETVASLEATVPAQASDRGFLPLFNATLLIAGLACLVVIVIASTSIAGRLTRPLHDVAAAARRLEAGETGARATGGDDRESAELAEAFNAMADRLERSEALRRRAASDIAHDLATPATVLESQLQAMIDGVVPADRAGLEAARSAAATMSALVGDLSDLASAEAAPMSVRPAAVIVTDVTRDVALALDGLARERAVRVEVDAADDVVAWADTRHLARAVRNVVANAIDHAPSGSAVGVAVTTDGKTVSIRVTDRGQGIDAEDLPHVFERFYRADRSRSADPETGRRPGSGLGLTIARELLAANGGAITVERTGPDGTTVLLTIPAAGRAA